VVIIEKIEWFRLTVLASLFTGLGISYIMEVFGYVSKR
jgi:hypothetical protein